MKIARARPIARIAVVAVVVATCTDRDPLAPPRPGFATIDVSSWVVAAQPGEPPVPVDTLHITLLRPGDNSPAVDTLLRLAAAGGDSLVVNLEVALRQTSENFLIDVLARGQGITWYQASGPVTITAGATARADLLATYVGPGYNAARVALQPVDTTAYGGASFTLRAVVLDSAGLPIPGVPVGFRAGNAALASVVQTGLATATFTGAVPLRDSVFIVAETPKRQRDSTRVHIRPPAAQLQKVSGDAQTGVVSNPLPLPLVVRVLDGLGGGFPGRTVGWSVTTGAATLSSATTVTDSAGFAAVTVTPTALGPIAIRADAGGLAGSPVSFTAIVAAGTVRQVTLDRVLDTIPKGVTLQYTATARDSAGNVVSAPITWVSTAPLVATVSTAGLATAATGGLSRIVASSGGFADTADLYVAAIQTIAMTPGDTVITAIGDSLLLAKQAFDNFGRPRAGLDTIRFTTATPGIAVVNALTGRVRLTGAGNAVIVARDSVTGVQGTATLRVNQVTFGVDNIPADSVLVGVGGQAQIVARALDRNFYVIAGKTFGWATRNAGIATVNATGSVTGVALGSTYAVDSVDGFKDSTRVMVVSAPPAVLQWGFDSTAVGAGSSASVALSVTQPPAAALTVTITSSDTTIAKPAASTTSIAAATSGTSVTVLGLRPGTVVLTASEAGYQSDSMIVAVVSTLEFREIASPCCRAFNFFVNQNETRVVQVWLSDPAPAGGLGVTFESGGGALVTPSPAIIPQGQLAAQVTIRGLVPGRDSVVPTAGGYTGRFAYVDVAPATLALYVFPSTVGVGQLLNPYVQIPYPMDHSLTVALSAARSRVSAAPNPVLVPTGSTLQSFDVVGVTLGADTVTAAAPGWTSGALPVVVTPPRLLLSAATPLVAGAPNGLVSVTTVDTAGYSHPVASALAVTLVSRRPTVVAIDTATLTVPARQGYAQSYALRPLAGGGGDSAFIVATAPGYAAESILIRVTGPALQLLLFFPSHVGVGTRFQNAGYVLIPFARGDTLRVAFGHTRRGIVSGPDTVLVLPGATFSYFDVAGDSLGTDSMSVTAPGYSPPPPQEFRVVPIQVAPYTFPGTLYTISRPQVVTAFVRDAVSPFYSHPLVAPLLVDFASTDPAVFQLDLAQVTIPANQFVSNGDTLRVVGTGTARLRTTAPGAAADSSGPIAVNPTPLTVGLSFPQAAGRGLRLDGNYVYLPDVAPDTVRVALAGRFPAVATVSPDTVVIPKGATTSGPFRIAANDSVGVDSITASAAGGYIPDTVAFTARPATLDVFDVFSTPQTTSPPLTVYIYARERFTGALQNAAAPVSVTVASTDSTVARIDSALSVLNNGATGVVQVDTGLYYAAVRIRFVGPGPARIRVSAAGFASDSTGLFTVTGPLLGFGYSTVTTGRNQVFQFQYVSVQNAPATNLVVRLARSDSGVAAASQIFGLVPQDSVVIPALQTYAYFDVIGKNSGAANLIARATGYSDAVATVSVGDPQLDVPDLLTVYVGQQPVLETVYTLDQTGNYRVVATPLVVTVASSDETVAKADSATLTVPALQGYASTGIRGLKKGTADIVFSAPGYPRPDTIKVTVDTGQLALFGPPNGLGPGQLSEFDLYVALPCCTAAALVVNLSSSNTGVLTVPNSVTIPAGNYFAYIPVTGVGLGTASVTATALGTRPDTVAVTIGQPRLLVSVASTGSVGVPRVATVVAQDANGITRKVTAGLNVSLVSSDPGNTTFNPPALTIPLGGSSAATNVSFAVPKSYTITANAPGYNQGSAVASAAGALVRMQAGPVFVPSAVSIKVGEAVTWRNDDPQTHTTTSDAPLWDQTRAPGQIFSRTFTATGTFPYHCNIHPAMTGTVTVTP